MIIAIQNLSSLVSSQDAYAMAMLVNTQLREHVAPAWRLLPPAARFIGASVPAGEHFDCIIGILDDSDQAGVLGWHTEGPDADAYGQVFAGPVLSNGGNALTADLSVCSVLSHEAIEAFLDLACNLWAQQASGTEIAREGCDPVEGDSYKLVITAEDGSSVSGTVSDFVLPSWFDPDAAPGATDHMGLLSGPFQVRSTGYTIEMTAGSVTEQWGATYPEWRKATKAHPGARTARRVSKPVPLLVGRDVQFTGSGVVPTTLA